MLKEKNLNVNKTKQTSNKKNLLHPPAVLDPHLPWYWICDPVFCVCWLIHIFDFCYFWFWLSLFLKFSAILVPPPSGFLLAFICPGSGPFCPRMLSFFGIILYYVYVLFHYLCCFDYYCFGSILTLTLRFLIHTPWSFLFLISIIPSSVRLLS